MPADGSAARKPKKAGSTTGFCFGGRACHVPTPRTHPSEWLVRLKPAQRKQLEDWQKANRWHPYQLRHNAATALRK
jgi:hypothetical protein